MQTGVAFAFVWPGCGDGWGSEFGDVLQRLQHFRRKRLLIADQFYGAEKDVVHEERNICERSHRAADIKVSIVFALQIGSLENDQGLTVCHRAERACTKLHRAGALDLACDSFPGPL